MKTSQYFGIIGTIGVVAAINQHDLNAVNITSIVVGVVWLALGAFLEINNN